MTNFSDEEYNEFVNVRLEQEKIKLLEYWLTRQKFVALEVNKESHSYTLSIRCNKCKCISKYDISPENLAKQTCVSCSICGETLLFIALQEYAKLIEKILELILDKRDVVFWGCGVFMQLFYSVSNIIQNSNIKIVDSKKFGETWHGKYINHPDFLKKERVDTIIVSAVDSFDAISKRIKKQVPHEYTSIAIYNLREIGFIQDDIRRSICES